MRTRRHNFTSRPTPRRAFTMIELIVVIIMLGVAAGVMSVRFTDTGYRTAQVKIAQVESLLETLAHRQIVSNAHFAVVFDTDELWLERLMQESGDEFGQWHDDPMVKPVAFDEGPVDFVALKLDGDVIRNPIRAQFRPGEPRPLLEIELAYEDKNVTLELLPHALSPVRRGDTESRNTVSQKLEAVDLDSEGRGDEEW